jgi:hypothetical protein
VEEIVMTTSRSLIGSVLVAWFLIVLLAGHAGVFDAGSGRPPLAILIAAGGPLIVFAVLYRASAAFQRFVLGIDLRWLTAMQSWRVIGVMFLALYAFGLLPGLFAWPAGLGDAAVGASAPFVLMALVRGEATWRRRVLWLNVAGLIDFIVAIATGALTSNSSLGVFVDVAPRASLGALPLSLVPSFAVPLWPIFHVVSLLQLRRRPTWQQSFTIDTHALHTASSSS